MRLNAMQAMCLGIGAGFVTLAGFTFAMKIELDPIVVGALALGVGSSLFVALSETPSKPCSKTSSMLTPKD
jgi:hypothetical protein